MKRIYIALLFMLTLFGLSACGSSNDEFKEYFKSSYIETEDLANMLTNHKDKFRLIDLRTEAEVSQSYIPGANLFYNVYDQDALARLLTLDKNKYYVLQCNSQNRSGQTYNIMKQNGFKHIVYLMGGIEKWISEGRPLTR